MIGTHAQAANSDEHQAEDASTRKRAESDARAKQTDAFSEVALPKRAAVRQCSTAAVVMMDGLPMTCLNCGRLGGCGCSGSRAYGIETSTALESPQFRHVMQTVHHDYAAVAGTCAQLRAFGQSATSRTRPSVSRGLNSARFSSTIFC